MTALDSAIDVLFDEILGLRAHDRLLILIDESGSSALSGAIADRARKAKVDVELGRLRSSESFYIEPDRAIAKAMRASSVILKLSSSCSLYYSTILKRVVRAGARAFFLTGLGPSELQHLIGSANHSELHALGDRLLLMLRRSRYVEIFSGRGCALGLSLGPAWAREFLHFRFLRRHLNAFFDQPTGLCRKVAAFSSLGGQVSFSGIRSSINGSLLIEGASFPPQEDCPLTAPFKIDVRRGRAVKIERTSAGQRFAEWLADNGMDGAREVMHISLGLNPLASLGPTMLVNERILGAVTMGLGYGARKAHRDLIAKSPSVWVDGLPLFEDGRLVHSGILHFPKALVRRGMSGRNTR